MSSQSSSSGSGGGVSLSSTAFPYDLVDEILQYLCDPVQGPKALLPAATTCKRWYNQLLDSEEVWGYLCHVRWPNRYKKTWGNGASIHLYRARLLNAKSLAPLPEKELHPIESCDFSFRCPMYTEALVRTNTFSDETGLEVYYCGVCKENVYPVEDQESLNKMAKLGRCVMFNIYHDYVRVNKSKPPRVKICPKPKIDTSSGFESDSEEVSVTDGEWLCRTPQRPVDPGALGTRSVVPVQFLYPSCIHIAIVDNSSTSSANCVLNGGGGRGIANSTTTTTTTVGSSATNTTTATVMNDPSSNNPKAINTDNQNNVRALMQALAALLYTPTGYTTGEEAEYLRCPERSPCIFPTLDGFLTCAKDRYRIKQPVRFHYVTADPCTMVVPATSMQEAPPPANYACQKPDNDDGCVPFSFAVMLVTEKEFDGIPQAELTSRLPEGSERGKFPESSSLKFVDPQFQKLCDTNAILLWADNGGCGCGGGSTTKTTTTTTTTTTFTLSVSEEPEEKPKNTNKTENGVDSPNRHENLAKVIMCELTRRFGVRVMKKGQMRRMKKGQSDGERELKALE